MTKPQPSIDFGYPLEPEGDMPGFQDIEEEAEFWDRHEVTDDGKGGWSVRPIADSEFEEQLTDRLDPVDRQVLLDRSREREMEPSELAMVWLKDRLRHEREKKLS